MNRNQAFIAACTTLTMLSGTAFSAQEQSFPDGIASQHELDLQEIAGMMINSLTAEEQRAIAEQGGLGADKVDLSQLDMTYDYDFDKVIPQGMSAIEYLDMLLSDDIRAKLNEEELFVLNNMAELMDQGVELPFFCFAPDANPEYAWMITELLDYQFVSDDGARFQQTNRWSRTAVDGSGLSQGDPTTITYSFVEDGAFIPNTGLGSGPSTMFAWLDSRYASTETWQNLFHQVFDRWEELTGITYIHELNDDGSNLNGPAGVVGVRGDVRIAAFNYPFDGNGGVLAYNNFPNDGDMIIDAFDTFYNNQANNSRRLRNVIAHEHGHGLGMAHVCPASATKLMEPFVSTNYDGPQLDDILNGQRHYGDPLEPNNSFVLATDLGTTGDSGIFNIDEASLDDNSDIDFYLLTLTERARITVILAPNAAQYLQGGQTQACNTGFNTNYNSIHDMKIDLYSAANLLSPVASSDLTGVGGDELLSYEAETAGDYYIFIEANNNTNNIQRYIASIIMGSLPPIECPADINMDGSLNFFDVSEFLAAFGDENPVADFTNDGEYNFFDVSDFLSQFGAGCP
jgi:Matrixin